MLALLLFILLVALLTAARVWIDARAKRQRRRPRAIGRHPMHPRYRGLQVHSRLHRRIPPHLWRLHEEDVPLPPTESETRVQSNLTSRMGYQPSDPDAHTIIQRYANYRST